MGSERLFLIFLLFIFNSSPPVAGVRVFSKDEVKKTKDSLRTPIIMVPGVMGSQLQARINRTSSPGFLCKYETNWTSLWLAYSYLTPLWVDCWVEDIRLQLDLSTGKVKNATGVEIRTTDFGETTTFEYLDPDEHSGPGSVYFINLVNSLISAGYVKGKDLRGAPFDWRLSPENDGIKSYIKQTIKLIETTYTENGNKKVIILCHSMGNLMMYDMLVKQPQEWKDKYISSHMSINAPYIGSVKALKAVTSGETEGHPFVLPKLKLRKAIRTMPSSYLMFPRAKFWPKDKEKILVTFEQNYTVNDYHDMLERLQCPNDECYKHWKRSGNTLGDMRAPGVAVHCIYATGLPTAETLIFDKDLFPDATPVLEYGDGDTTVNVWSASYCLNWREQQKEPIYDVQFRGNSHVGLLSNSSLHDYVKKFAIQSKLRV